MEPPDLSCTISVHFSTTSPLLHGSMYSWLRHWHNSPCCTRFIILQEAARHSEATECRSRPSNYLTLAALRMLTPHVDFLGFGICAVRPTLSFSIRFDACLLYLSAFGLGSGCQLNFHVIAILQSNVRSRSSVGHAHVEH